MKANTDTGVILTMLDDIHTMQRNGEGSTISVNFSRNDSALYVELYASDGAYYDFRMSSAYDIDANLDIFRQLEKTWLYYEERKLH